MSLKSSIRKCIPEFVLLFYHYVLALIAAAFYGFPSKKMVVIGITGTKGKTTTTNFIWSCLNAGGLKTGIISTANIRIGQNEILNKYHMTMPGRFQTQKILKEMVKAGCEYCVVETTSEGIKQSRHIGVFHDIVIFTNLTPEHLQAHGGSFEKYKATKGIIFKNLSQRSHKVLKGKKIEKVIIANGDSEHGEYYLSFTADKKITFGFSETADFQAFDIEDTTSGVRFQVKDQQNQNSYPYQIHILGKFNVINALPAIAVSRFFNIAPEKINAGLQNLTSIPGRMELINEGQDFTVVVDYAHEKEGITAILDAANTMKKSHAKVIILLGAEGGGRDTAKRPIMGELSAQKADYVIVSNVDPYEDDPTKIVEDITIAAEHSGKVRGQNLFVIEDRREGIHHALSLAKKDDIVLITGKGAEQSIVVNGIRSAWDDRTVTREELAKVLKKH